MKTHAFSMGEINKGQKLTVIKKPKRRTQDSSHNPEAKFPFNNIERNIIYLTWKAVYPKSSDAIH